jgi:hypothetical protein
MLAPSAYFAPELSDSLAGRSGDAKNRIAAAAAAPALFESPAPAPASAIVAPLAPTQDSWSMPQVDRAAPRAASPSEEIPAPVTDGFAMPVNQLPGN